MNGEAVLAIWGCFSVALVVGIVMCGVGQMLVWRFPRKLAGLLGVILGGVGVVVEVIAILMFVGFPLLHFAKMFLKGFQ
jgi:hypothetical protein